jgi:hypothetical protein
MRLPRGQVTVTRYTHQVLPGTYRYWVTALGAAHASTPAVIVVHAPID